MLMYLIEDVHHFICSYAQVFLFRLLYTINLTQAPYLDIWTQVTELNRPLEISEQSLRK